MTQSPLVVFFRFEDCKACAQTEREVLTDPGWSASADKGVFAFVDINEDDAQKNVSKMMESLKLERCPVLVLLDAYPDQILERQRILGHFPAPEYLKYVAEDFASPPKPRASR